MPLVSDIAAKVRAGAAKLLDGGSRIFGGLKDLVKGPAARAADLTRDWEAGLWLALPEGFRGKLSWLEGKLVPTLGVLILAPFILLLVLAFSRPPAAPPAGPAAGVFRSVPIPPEDLFLPEEPDFLPGVLLDREQREAWTAEDAETFWYNPLEDGEEGWRDQVEKVIDDLLERVP
jgi:hypothetical protein